MEGSTEQCAGHASGRWTVARQKTAAVQALASSLWAGCMYLATTQSLDKAEAISQGKPLVEEVSVL